MSEKETAKKETKKTNKKQKNQFSNLGECLQYIQSNLKAPKSQYNKFGNYNYRNCEDILEALKPLLAETKTTLTIYDEIVQFGERYYVRANIRLNLGNNNIVVYAFAREPESRKGMDVAQITGATSSYARKYALNGLFAIDDARDPDTQDNSETTTGKPQDIKQPDNIPKSISNKPTNIGHDETSVLNFIIETIAPKAVAGNIVDIKKLKSAILEKYKQLPTKLASGEVVVKYILDKLGIDKVSIKNDFLKDLD